MRRYHLRISSLAFPVIAIATLTLQGHNTPGVHGFSEREAKHHAPDHSEYDRETLRWWKGNLHTHTLWSDGDSFPELVVDWYKRHGYHFLALSDHNVLSEGRKWINPLTHSKARGRGKETLKAYIERFGENWVETRKVDEATLEWLSTLDDEAEILEHGQKMRYRIEIPPEELEPEVERGDTIVRLKPLNEFRTLFEEPGRFLMIQSEEISAPFKVHVNATNLVDFIPPFKGKGVKETIQLNFDAVYRQRENTGQPMFPHLNHPNFKWAVTAEDMVGIEGLRFFEVYNGHPSINNDGDEQHPGLERIWDIVLTRRLAEENRGLVYALAVDDAHEYHADPEKNVPRPGRGWVVVRAPFLTPEHLIAAMEAGDFYASTGVQLNDIRSDGGSLRVEIKPEPNVNYVTQFIGTRRGVDLSSRPRLDDAGNEIPNSTHRYSDAIGEVLAEIEGVSPRYEFRGDELYVRAKVISTKPKENPYSEKEKWEVAWIQPVVPPEFKAR